MVAYLLFWGDFMSALRKNILPIIFTAFYALMSLLEFDFYLYVFSAPWRYAVNSLVTGLLPLLTPIFVLCFLLLINREYGFKSWLLPISFAIKFILIFMSICSSISLLPLMDLASVPIYYTLLACSFLNCLSLLCMFVGGLFNFKYLNLLKYGSLAASITVSLSPVIEFVFLGGFAYLKSIPEGYAKINYISLLTNISAILFYIGIFIFTLNISKKNEG